MRRRLLACLAASLISSAAMADPTLVEMLEGEAAACSITGGSLGTEAFLARRDYGERSAKYKKAVDKAYKESKSCVDTGKPKIRPYVKSEIEKYPKLKPVITEAYAAWLGYMDWLSTPRDYSDESAEKRNYEAAINRLKAEIEVM
ncbi:hypothetical protein [uncultured Pseudomonas sp.]|uniref:hypothetical protein n=1 Tax=uncultured Pseudomonas sp. TaxID=114707 RepID=UPI002053FB0E|nr:hypothetical protein [uncultured Pseudomonas sp.]DAM47925.1 MAG TPA: hypothetical protein [Caudoviricetes sp.]